MPKLVTGAETKLKIMFRGHYREVTTLALVLQQESRLTIICGMKILAQEIATMHKTPQTQALTLRKVLVGNP
jgi:hypothetical protein